MFENRNYGFIPKTPAPEGVSERDYALEGLFHYCNSDRDEESRGKSEEMFGETVSLTDDAKTRNRFIGRALAAHNGFIGKPDAYMKAANMEFPPKFKDAGDLYEAIGERFHDNMRGAWDKRKKQMEAINTQRERFEAIVDYALDGKLDRLGPSDIELLQQCGFTLADMQMADSAMKAARKWLKNKNKHFKSPEAEDALIEMAIALERDKGGRIAPLVMSKVAAEAERESERIEGSGFGGKVLDVAGRVATGIGDVAWNTLASLVPGRGQAIQASTSSYRQVAAEIQQAVYSGALSPDDAAREMSLLQDRYARGQKLRGGLLLALEEGEEATRQRHGLTVHSAAKTIADLGLMLLEYTPVTTGGTVQQGVLDKRARYAYMYPDGNAAEQQSRALAYSAAEYAGFRFAPKVVWSGVGRLFGATAGKLGGGAVGKAVGRGMSWMNRSATGAAAMGAVRGVGDVGVIIPGATGTLHALYDVVPGTDARLDSGLQELSGLWQQLGKGEYWAETAITGGAFGLMNVPAWKKAQRLAKEKQGEIFLDLGGSPEYLEKVKKTELAQDLPKLLREEIKREKNEDKGAVIQRSIDRARGQLKKLQDRQERGDNAVKAMMASRGYEVVPEGDQFRLYYNGGTEAGKSVRGEKSILLSAEDLDTFISLQMDTMGKIGALVMRDAMAKKRLADAMTLLDVDVEWMPDAMNGKKVEEAAAKARERVESRVKELMEQEKLGKEEARRRAEEEVHEDVLDKVTAGWLKNDEGKTPTLKQVISYGEQWQHRREQAEAGGVTAKGSRANVRTFYKKDGSIRRVLRVALGASTKEIAEELGEQAALRFMEGSGGERINPVQAFRLLDSLREWMKGHDDKEIAGVADTFLTMHKDKEREQLYQRIMDDAFDVNDIDSLTPEEEAYIRAEVVEGMSRLMFSDLMRDVLTKNPELPGWARELGADLTLDMAEAAQQFMLAKAFMEARAQGWLTDAVEKTTGLSRDTALKLVAQGAEAVRNALRGKAEPEPGEYLDALYRQEKAQAELDALFGSDKAVAPEKFDAFEQEAREGQEKLDEARAEAEQELADKAAEDVAETQADNPEMTHEEAVKATNEKKNKNRQEQIETAVDAEHDPDFEGGVCQTVADPNGGAMCKLGFISIAKLKVLPNFKLGADTETGVVEPLKGDYRADHDPIRVWRRADGTLEVISGRHRLDAAKRAGMDKISAFVYEESEVHDEQWARRYDIESNIRDNQATALEVALYVRGEWNGGRALTDEEIARAGIARKGKAGAIGCEIARHGSQAVIDAWRNGALTEQQAFWIASFMPGNERAQRAGVGMATSGDVTKGEILTAMEAAEAIGEMGDSLGVGQEVDLFGNAIDNDGFLNFVAKYITRKRNEIGKDLAYIGATATKRNAAEMAKKYGVDIKDPEAMKRKQEELQRLKERWKNPYTDHELMGEIREAYRKETLEGWAEGEGAKGAVEGEETPAELPGEAEGQGTLFSREPASLRIWNARLHDLHRGQGSVAGERTESHFSVVAQKEVQGLRKCVEGVLGKERKGKIYNPNVGNMTLEWGKVVDKKAVGAGVMHITEHRLFQGLTLNEIGRVIAYALKAAETVVPKKTRGVRLMFERFGVKAVAAINEKQGNPIITGFVLGTQGKKEAVDSVAALATERFYALDELGRIQEVGAALRDGIAHFEEIVKNNPHNWEQIVSSEVEMLKIKQNAKHDGTFMKAPNGKPTKLTETQWLQVRTKAFKGWFGDWENDPENASKVVDENGEPRVVYHGTREGFTVFDRDKSGRSTTYAKVGFWFSNVEGFGERFARGSWWGNGEAREMSLFLNLRNPKIYENSAEADYGDSYERFRTDVVSVLGKDAEFANIGGIGKAWPVYFDKDDMEKQREYYARFPWQEKSDKMMGTWREWRTKQDVLDEYIQKHLVEQGYDGILIRQTRYDKNVAGVANDQYVALEPTQIKSATDNRGTFEAGNADITFSVSEHNLGAVHSITPLNLVRADQLGGMPMPSIAVTRLDKPYRFLDLQKGIYLVGAPDLVNPRKKVDVTARDGWTVTFPQITRKPKKGKDITAYKEQLYRDFKAAEDEYFKNEYNYHCRPDMWYIINGEYGGGDIESIRKQMETTPAIMALYGKERGYAPKPYRFKDKNLDYERNHDRIREYVAKHREDYDEWIESKLAPMFGETLYIEGTNKEATLENITAWMKKRAGANGGLLENVWGFGLNNAKAARAAKMLSMDDVKAQRGRIGGNEEVGQTEEATKAAYERMVDEMPKHYNSRDSHDWDDMRSSLFKAIAAVPKDCTVRQFQDELAKQLKRNNFDDGLISSMSGDVALAEAAVETVKAIDSEMTYYLEAKPRRAVTLDEFKYAVMSKRTAKDKRVMDVLKRNGIKPVIHDGTAEGYDAAMAGLVNNADVSFSIFGMTARGASVADEKGETYVDPADGKKKWVVSDAESRLRDNFTFGQLNVAAGGHKDTTLGAILHFPALFENYPDLEGMRVRFYKPRESDGLGGYFNPYPADGSAAYIAVNIGACRTPGKVLETLRHESQHAIQSAEGHAMGGGFRTPEEASRYLEHAIEQRKDRGVDDAWSRDNLAFLENLLERVKTGNNDAVTDTYLYSRGEQEARFTGSGYGVTGEEPKLGGVNGMEPSHYTVAVTTGATELGGVTFGGMGRFAYLLETRLLPSMEFTHDRQIMQMKETVVRMTNQLRMLPEGKADGLKLAAEGLNLMERLTSLLPNTYRMALEPYRLYFTYYSILHGTGDAGRASEVIPMEGWDNRMEGAMRNMATHLLTGEVQASDMKYWFAHPELMSELTEAAEAAKDAWKEAWEQSYERHADLIESNDGKVTKSIEKSIKKLAQQIFMEGNGAEFYEKAFRAIGEIRADKLMDKFLERVALQLDHFRKDRTLGKIRRVVDSVNVTPNKDGKPRKGMMHADDYRKLMDLVSLMEMTKSERENVLDLYDGEHEGLRKWEEMEAAEMVPVEVYDADGKKKTVSVSKQEFDVYASFEQMTAAQAESMSRALGEFITTGRQAWQNSEEAAKARIGRLCAPLLEGFTETENERRKRELDRIRSFGQHMLSFIFNDAQFFHVMSADAACRDWAGDFAQRIADGHCDCEMWEKERAEFTWDAICRAAGTRDREKAVLWLDSVKSTRDSGVTLVPHEPDYAADAEAVVRRQLLSLMHRKTKLKNFSPNKFAETVRWMASRADSVVPKAIREELVQKYGRIGNADKSILKGEAAAASLFSEAEFRKFRNIGTTIQERAAKDRDTWREKHEERMQEINAGGERLELSQAEAAYRVLLCEQEDYKEMMALQGYDEATVAKLRKFAGDAVMKLAYELRKKLGERTPQMKALYEKMYGTPFPEVENYFRAYFDAGNESRENKLLGSEGVGNAAGGGKVKVLYTRTKHNQKVDPTMDVLNAFESAMKEQDTLFAWGQLGQDIKRVLNHRQSGLSMRKALEEKYGNGWVREMDRWGDMFNSITAEHEEFARSAGKFIRAAGSASAQIILNGRGGSLMKQFTAIFNSLCGSELVGVWEWKAAMGRFTSGLGKISMKEMAKRPELAGRFKGWDAAMNKEAALEMPDVKSGHGATAPWTRYGMSLMEYLDVRANVVSCCVLYDAVYRKLQKADKTLTHEQLDEAAMCEVRMSLALKSQPMDFRSRAMMATKQSVMSAGSLFLGGESINTFANIFRLAARKEWKKAAAVWLVHGAALQVLTFLYNWLTDDKEQWERRHWWHYAEQTLLGPLMGIPLVSAAISQGIGALSTVLPGKYRPWLPTQSLLPIGDFSRSFGEFNRAFFGKKPSSWQDKVIATETALRSLLLIGCVVYRNPQNPKDAAIKGGLYGASLISNALDFLLRGERAVEERAFGE